MVEEVARGSASGDGAVSRFDEWFMYFPDNYRWSAALAGVLGSAPFGGAEIGEVDEVGRELSRAVGDDDAWFAAWEAMGEKVRENGESEVASRHRLSGAASFLRACNYYLIGERFRLPKDGRGLEAFRKGVECFERFAELTDSPTLERVEIPYEGTSLPAYFVRPIGRVEPWPCVVFFDGLDITKELQFLRGVPDIVRRGMACLIVDGPGNGESIRLRELSLRPDYEVAGTAAFNYLESRVDVDSERVAVMAISLGGYYAARCASMEHRFAACVSWGAIWDYRATWLDRIGQDFQTAMPVVGDHIRWILGCKTFDEVLKRLEGFRLDGVVQSMRCPYLLLHGARDEQVPLGDAQALFAAVGSADKTFHIFDEESGGATHCQHDRLTAATTLLSDWLADRLEA